MCLEVIVFLDIMLCIATLFIIFITRGSAVNTEQVSVSHIKYCVKFNSFDFGINLRTFSIKEEYQWLIYNVHTCICIDFHH